MWCWWTEFAFAVADVCQRPDAIISNSHSGWLNGCAIRERAIGCSRDWRCIFRRIADQSFMHLRVCYRTTYRSKMHERVFLLCYPHYRSNSSGVVNASLPPYAFC